MSILKISLVTILVGTLSACAPKVAPILNDSLNFSQASVPAMVQMPKFVVDTDPNGMRDAKEYDDRAVAIWLERNSLQPEFVASTSGNTTNAEAYKNAQALYSVPVYQGGSTCTAPAIQQYQKLLSQSEIVIFALGSLTNVATLLRCHPELQHNILSVVVVAGRQPGEEFWLNPALKLFRPLKDLNYETDSAAGIALLQSGVRVKMVPFAAGNAVRLHSKEMRLSAVEERRAQITANGLRIVGSDDRIPMFDLVALTVMIWPRQFDCQPAQELRAGVQLVAYLGTQPTNIEYCLPNDADTLTQYLRSTF